MQKHLQDHDVTRKETQRIAGAMPKAKPASMPVDTRLAVFKDRLTYTFILDSEVASIHFDRNRGEIFYKGHNIINLELSENQKKVLKSFLMVLEGDAKGKEFLNAYSATLERSLADKQKVGE